MLKGYFFRKPEHGDEVRAAVREGYSNHVQPVEIEEVGRVILTLDEYIAFCNHLWYDYDFLKPYADDSAFTENSARCVLVGAPGQPWLATCLEGYHFPRYCAWPFADEYQLNAMLKD